MQLNHFFKLGAGEVVGEDLRVGEALVGHDGCTDLAQSYTMSPPSTAKQEILLGGVVGSRYALHIEG